MKNIYVIRYGFVAFVAFISSCDKEEIVFDHELPQFELRSDAICWR